MITIIAMGIVFIVLALLMYVLKVQTIIFKDRKKQNRKAVLDSQAAGFADKNVEDSGNSPQSSMQPSREEEVLAAIIAAVCTYTSLSSNEFTIRSIKRADGTGSQWRRSGIL